MSAEQRDLDVANGLIVEIHALIETRITGHTDDRERGQSLAAAVVGQLTAGVLAGRLLTLHEPGCPGIIDDLPDALEFIIQRVIQAALPPLGFPADALAVATTMDSGGQPEAVH